MSDIEPEFGKPLPAAHPSDEAVTLLRLRRSTSVELMEEPGPDAETLDKILAIAARVPDHRRVTPFRFVIFEGDARARFGDVLKQAFLANEPDATEAKVECERCRFLRAPVVIALISSVNRDHRTPEWEQLLTAGAVGQTMLLAASAYGFAAQWLTEWYAFDDAVMSALGLGEAEQIAGFIYLGTAREDPKERARPDMGAITSHY